MSQRLVTLYNSLPSVSDADANFVNRDEFFSKVAPLLNRYGGKFGVCLVHRHCTIEEGEMMVATGNVTQPERDVECYPDRWTPDGEGFEFTRDVVESPPPALFDEFKALTKAHGVDYLGLCFVQELDSPDGKVPIERTEGRKNIIKYGAPLSSSIVTNWVLRADTDILAMQARCVCTSGGHFVTETVTTQGQGSPNVHTMGQATPFAMGQATPFTMGQVTPLTGVHQHHIITIISTIRMKRGGDVPCVHVRTQGPKVINNTIIVSHTIKFPDSIETANISSDASPAVDQHPATLNADGNDHSVDGITFTKHQDDRFIILTTHKISRKDGSNVVGLGFTFHTNRSDNGNTITLTHLSFNGSPLKGSVAPVSDAIPDITALSDKATGFSDAITGLSDKLTALQISPKAVLDEQVPLSGGLPSFVKN